MRRNRCINNEHCIGVFHFIFFFIRFRRSSLMSSTRLGEELFEETAHIQSPGGGGGHYYHLFFDEAGFGTDCHPRDSIQCVRDPVAARFTLVFLYIN